MDQLDPFSEHNRMGKTGKCPSLSHEDDKCIICFGKLELNEAETKTKENRVLMILSAISHTVPPILLFLQLHLQVEWRIKGSKRWDTQFYFGDQGKLLVSVILGLNEVRK